MNDEEPHQFSENKKTEDENKKFILEKQNSSELSEDRFSVARQAWKWLGTQVNWTLLFGDLYVKRFPVEVQSSASATAVKKSIFEADDSVHAWDATGVRRTIVKQMITAESRGVIREYYADLAFFCERMNFLKGIQEEDIDFVVRASLLADPEISMSQVRNELLDRLDPQTTIITDSIKKNIMLWAMPQLEMYGFLVAMTKELFPYSEEEVEEIISLLLDVNKVDQFFRVRFLDPTTSDEPKPLLGFEHEELTTEENFALKYLAFNDREYYPLRLCQLWLFALLREFPEVEEFLQEQRSNLLAILADLELKALKKLLRDCIMLTRWYNTFMRFEHTLRTDYAYGKDYTGHASDLSHLLETQGELMARLPPEEDFPIPFDRSRLDKNTTLLSLGVTCIESVMKRFEEQIPIPEGTGSKRSIMAKRRLNLRNAVLSESVQAEILDKIIEIKDYESPKDIEEGIRFPGDILFPRGEAYFRDMKEYVKQQMEALGDLDLRKELKLTTDTPQSLVKQYGNSAVKWLKVHFPDVDLLSDDLTIYSAILSLKGTELMFSSATTSEEQRNSITKQLYENVFHSQLQSLEKLAQEQQINKEES